MTSGNWPQKKGENDEKLKFEVGVDLQFLVVAEFSSGGNWLPIP